jgi:hypothetical protein
MVESAGQQAGEGSRVSPVENLAQLSPKSGEPGPSTAEDPQRARIALRLEPRGSSAKLALVHVLPRGSTAENAPSSTSWKSTRFSKKEPGTSDFP